MAYINRKIIGVSVRLDRPDLTDFDADTAIDYANKIYNEVQEEYASIQDTGTLRAITILKIVLELQTIKGKQDVFLDTNNKKIKELINLMDSVDSLN